MFGSYFDVARVEPTWEENLIIDNAMDTLAPYFGIDLEDDERWDKIALPTVVIGERPFYRFSEKLITIPEHKFHQGNGTIGHELGHWYHSVIYFSS